MILERSQHHQEHSHGIMQTVQQQTRIALLLGVIRIPIASVPHPHVQQAAQAAASI